MRVRRSILLVAAFIAVAPAAHADMGLPMLALTLPAALWALIPVILVEAYVFKRHGFAFKWSLQWNAVANVVSTVAGVPLAWLALVIADGAIGSGIYSLGVFHKLGTTSGRIFDFLIHFPWLPPVEDMKYYGWAVPTAFLMLLVPFFFASWQIEYRIIAGRNKDKDAKAIRRASFYANLVSYVLLAFYPVCLYFAFSRG